MGKDRDLPFDQQKKKKLQFDDPQVWIARLCICTRWQSGCFAGNECLGFLSRDCVSATGLF